MTNSALAASLVASLAWPALVAGLVICFREPLRKLIGRIRAAEIAGSRFEFGHELSAAEAKTDQAVSDVTAISGSVDGVIPPSESLLTKQPPIKRPLTPSQQAEWAHRRMSELALVTEANPSFAIIRAWEDLADLLFDYASAVLKERPPGTRNPWWFLPVMRDSGDLTPSYVEAVRGLQNLRNKVAHGDHQPTPGEAVTYVDTASKLASVAALQLGQYVESHAPDSEPVN
jgi:hypothetical protein